MYRLKEQSRLERERRHLERVTKRKSEEPMPYPMKTQRTEEVAVVTVSDNSDVEMNETYEEVEEKSDKSVHSNGSIQSSR